MIIKQSAIVMLILVATSNVWAETYQYKDSSGNLVFTDDISKVPARQRSSVTIRAENAENSSSSINITPSQHRSTQLQKDIKFDEPPIRSSRCPDQSSDEAERAIKDTWNNMVGALLAGNTQKALEYFAESSKEEYRQILTVKYKGQIKKLFAGYEGFVVESIHDIDAQGGVIRNEAEGKYSYPVSFLRVEPDCEWKIRSF